ncbi:hypothetical protein F9B74_00015 [Pelistega sp. NLN82]|uniref:Transferrin-binding protein B C-lobe/N-lobe beta barrel domain-containing protein n=1 Tax=Pelistega ratti TaxID=2652177 RepID=A0A6L9Y3B5_9BURK|nr:Slam-dependent surface lipoprotein [Pelistega ratti]NEN74716.1 hypothetical protein [Pelistega ratti]
MSLHKLMLLLTVGVFAVPSYAESISGYTSKDNKGVIETGESSAIPFGAGKPGISINGSASINLEAGPIKHIKQLYGNKPINSTASQDVDGKSNPKYLRLKDVNKVIGLFYNPTLGQVWYENRAHNTEVYSVRQIADPAVPAAPKFGGLVVAKVTGLQDASVYFGEWAPRASNPSTGSDTNLGMNSASREVFYVGENPTGNVAGLATAKYNVVGINQHTPGKNDFYTGTLTANFGNGGQNGQLSGELVRGNHRMNFAGTTIENNGKFSRNFAGMQNKHDIEGRFYGKGAAAIAGFAKNGTPDNPRDDVAFGGRKQ